MAEDGNRSETRLIGKKGAFHFEMSVEVEGRLLEIYDRDEENSGISRDVVRGYIASQEGKCYVLKYAVKMDWTDLKAHTKAYPAVWVSCYVDGIHVHSQVYEKSSRSSSTVVRGLSSGHRTRKFVFAALQTTEEETPMNNLSQLGTIVLKIRRCKHKFEKVARKKKKTLREKSPEAAIMVNENAKKGTMLGAVTRFEDGSNSSSSEAESSSDDTSGGTQQKRTVSMWYYHPKDSEKKPFLEMRLRYAPEALLVANHHIPRSPPRSPEAESQRTLSSPLTSASVENLEWPVDTPSPLAPDAQPLPEPVDATGSGANGKRARSPECNERHQSPRQIVVPDEKRIKVSAGLGLDANDAIDLDGESEDDAASTAQAAATAKRAEAMREIANLRARLAEAVAQLERPEGSQDVKDRLLKQESKRED